MSNNNSSVSERPLEVEADGLVMWMDGDCTPVEIHAVMEYLTDRELLTERGEDLYSVFWENYLNADKLQPDSETKDTANSE